ncbi:hypothetical protein KFK09_024724 [Dendrobium nobile]|uniref:Uncharacterized protein n=1 Tax=Dendrobium nobile TaxID=94219 RepID=A0A8T3AES4_DENNO|nr:hypothetical protein KFK09_024724 [Dendrobium nobile]
MGKGKENVENLDRKKNLTSLSSPSKNLLSKAANNPEASSSTGFKLKVKKFSNISCTVDKQEILNWDLKTSKRNEVLNNVAESQLVNEKIVLQNPINGLGDLVNAWSNN